MKFNCKFYIVGPCIVTCLFINLIFCCSMFAKEYGCYDPKRLLIISESTAGRKSSFDLGYFDKMLDDLLLHAKNYPPHFDTLRDRQRARQDVEMLSGVMNILMDGPSPNSEILYRAALVNHIGHNFDIPGAAEKAASIFQNILKVTPSDSKANFMYGVFLAGIGKPDEAIPYLQKAISVGVVDANYSIGMAYITLGNREKSLQYLEAYRLFYPNDESVNNIIAAIRSGNVKYEKKTIP